VMHSVSHHISLSRDDDAGDVRAFDSLRRESDLASERIQHDTHPPLTHTKFVL